MRAETKRAVCDTIGGLVLIALMWGLCWLCCAASGYHWE